MYAISDFGVGVQTQSKYMKHVETQKNEAPSEARCESVYIAFSLYKCPGTYRNSELHLKYWIWDLEERSEVRVVVYSLLEKF